MKKVAMFILCFLLFTSFSTALTEEVKNPYGDSGNTIKERTIGEFKEAAVNGDLKLFYEEGTGLFYVESISSGEKFYSYPISVDQDKTVTDVERGSVKSSVCVNILHTDEMNEEIISLESFYDCVLKGGLKVIKVDNGIGYRFAFPEYDITIDISVILTGNKLKISFNTADIKENRKYRVVDISLFPYFNCSLSGEKGYLFIPDGSGAIIDFESKQKGKPTQYNSRVYGDNLTFTKYSKTKKTQEIKMPVFGIKKENSSLTAVITNGSANSYITAQPQNENNGYSAVYAAFLLRESDIFLFTNEYKTDINIYQKTSLAKQEYSVDYNFLIKKNSNYVDMANVYREYLDLKDKNLLKPYFYTDIYGAAVKQKSFLGIPIKQEQKLTTFNEANIIADKLYQSKVENLLIRYVNWSDSTTWNKMMTNNSPSSSLGGTVKLKQLISSLKQKGYEIYLDGNPINVKKGKNPLSYFFDFAQTIRNTTAKIYTYRLSTNVREENSEKSYLIKSSSIPNIFEQFGKSVQTFNPTGVSVSGTDLLYTDFRKKDGTSEITKQSMIKGLQNMSQDMLITDGNDYTLKYAKHILNTPDGSSNYDVESESVPFYQIVIHAALNYAMNPINEDPDPQVSFLKAVETGSSLYFSFIYRNANLTSNSDHSNLYFASFDAWFNEAVRMNSEYHELFEKIYNSKIVNHEKLAKNVYKTTYENGQYTIVNYSDNGFNNTPAMSFSVNG